MTDAETVQILTFTLETLRLQLEYSHTLHGWIIALNETLQQQNPEFAALVVQHHFYSDPNTYQQTIAVTLQNIDLVIQRLKDQKG